MKVNGLFRLILIKIVYRFQLVILIISYWLSSHFVRDVNRTKWVVGLDEIASIVHHMSSALVDSIAVNLSNNKYYNYEYDFILPKIWGIKAEIIRYIYGPLLLGYLSANIKGFIYVGGGGYLLSTIDGREEEFEFLKSKGCKVICFFCGSEIRSVHLTNKLAKTLDRDLITTYQIVSDNEIERNWDERGKFMLAQSADRYADHIFSAPIDQLSYIKRHIQPFIYFYPESRFLHNPKKFERLKKIKILHAPSSPIIKGTPLVRSAIKKLKLEGFVFDYKELVGVKNSEILKELQSSHIVLNEFYALMPGVFGVEALASHCALLTSADENIEKGLPARSNSAWMVTEYWNIYDNLKILLKNNELIVEYANNGYAWALAECAYRNSAARFLEIIDRD